MGFNSKFVAVGLDYLFDDVHFMHMEYQMQLIAAVSIVPPKKFAELNVFSCRMLGTVFIALALRYLLVAGVNNGCDRALPHHVKAAKPVKTTRAHLLVSIVSVSFRIHNLMQKVLSYLRLNLESEGLLQFSRGTSQLSSSVERHHMSSFRNKQTILFHL